MQIGFKNCCSALTQWLLIASFSLISLGSVSGQEATFEQLKQQWQSLDAKLTAKESALTAADGADIDEMQEELSALIGQADELIVKLENSAYAKLKTDPDNQDCIRTLMGIALNDARNSRDAKVLKMGDRLIKSGINPKYFEIASKHEDLKIGQREIFDELIIRQSEALENTLPRVKFKTTQGDIVVELFENQAPETVGNFISLVESGWYSNKIFHRVLEDFMAQTGGFEVGEDGEETGGEGPGYEIECECDSIDTRQHFSGSLSMAHRGKDTGGAQLFLTFERTSHLDGAHTCFGRVIEGFRSLELLARTHTTGANGRDVKLPGVVKDKIISAEVLRKRDHVYRPNKVGVDEAAEDAARQKAEEEKLAAEKAAMEKAAAEKEAREKVAREKAAALEKAAAEKKMAQQKAAAEKAAAEKKMAEEKLAAAKAAAEKKMAEKQAAAQAKIKTEEATAVPEKPQVEKKTLLQKAQEEAEKLKAQDKK